MEKVAKNMDGNVIENTFARADEAIKNANVKGGEYWKRAKAQGKNLWSGAQVGGRKSWNWTKGFIEKHPAQAVGYAVLLGVVLGVLLAPKEQD